MADIQQLHAFLLLPAVNDSGGKRTRSRREARERNWHFEREMLHREVNGWSRQRKPVGLDTLGWFDFEVGPGPALYVYLVPKEQVRQSAGVKNTIFVHLGRLRAFKAAMKYNIPAGVDLKAYPSVVIWCARFGVLISPADLKFER